MGLDALFGLIGVFFEICFKKQFKILYFIKHLSKKHNQFKMIKKKSKKSKQKKPQKQMDHHHDLVHHLHNHDNDDDNDHHHNHNRSA